MTDVAIRHIIDHDGTAYDLFAVVPGVSIAVAMLSSGADPTATASVDETTGAITIALGIPRGYDGATGTGIANVTYTDNNITITLTDGTGYTFTGIADELASMQSDVDSMISQGSIAINSAISSCNDAVTRANAAINNANTATNNANEATTLATNAAQTANDQAENAQTAAENIGVAINGTTGVLMVTDASGTTTTYNVKTQVADAFTAVIEPIDVSIADGVLAATNVDGTTTTYDAGAEMDAFIAEYADIPDAIMVQLVDEEWS